MTFAIDVTRLRADAAAKVASDAIAASLLAPPSNIATLAGLAFLDGSNPTKKNQRPESLSTRYARLKALGMSDDQADALAERLFRRDSEADDRRMCAAECQHFVRGRCRNAVAAGMHPELGDIATMLQRCHGYRPAVGVTGDTPNALRFVGHGLNAAEESNP